MTSVPNMEPLSDDLIDRIIGADNTAPFSVFVQQLAREVKQLRAKAFPQPAPPSGGGSGDAERALRECGIAGIFDEFRDPADAITQMALRIRELEGPGPNMDELVGRPEALSAGRVVTPATNHGPGCPWTCDDPENCPPNAKGAD